MPRRQIILLASSRRNGGRCVAGVDRYSLEWVRLVDLDPDVALDRSHLVLDDGSDSELLDTIEVECGPHPLPDYQTENLLAADEPWRLVARPAPEFELLRLNRLIEQGSCLFGFGGDFCERETVERSRKTLCMVSPTNITWIVKQNPNSGRLQIRARFSLETEPYDLAVTDPNIENLFAGSDYGEYSEDDVRIQDRVGYIWDAGSERLIFVVSLGRAYGPHSRCFKLIAGVTTIPFQEQRERSAELEIGEVSNTESEVAAVLSAAGLEVVDKRPAGCLWVKGGAQVGERLRLYAPAGYEFRYAPNGGRATGHLPAWFMVSK